MQLEFEITGMCSIRGNENYFGFWGLHISYCVRDRSSSYYRGLGGTFLRGHFVNLSFGPKVVLDGPSLFDLEAILERAKPDIDLDVSAEIAFIRNSIMEALRISAKNELGIDF